MEKITELIKAALYEDMPAGDITTDYLFSEEQSHAIMIAKEEGVISGIDVAKETFELVDSTLVVTLFKPNGTLVKKGDIIAEISGKTASILKGERVALNFLQRMSGIATLTHRFVAETNGYPAKILDTRKTTPNLRILEKQAVKDGGGTNHRFSLSDMVMIKDNHIKAAGSITRAVERIRQSISPSIRVEVEIETIAQMKEALETDVDIIMLDNMSCDLMSECVTLNHHQKQLEASGNMTLDRIKEVAMTGVDFISVGALTHSYHSLDISLRFL